MVSIVKVYWGVRLLMLEIELLGTCFWRHGCSPRIYPAFHTACPRFVDICEAGTINMLSGRSFAYKGPYSQSYGFSSNHVWMRELEHKEGWAPKNWCFWTVVLEKTLESSLDSKEIKPVNPKGNQSWIFIGRTDIEAEALILWPPAGKNWLIEKDPDAEKDWRQEEKWTTEDEMGGWHYQLNGHEFE